MTLSLIPDYELAKHTWLGVGGKADFFGIMETLEDLKDFLKQNKLPVTVLGGGSNVLIRDGGIEGVVLKLGKGFQAGAEFYRALARLRLQGQAAGRTEGDTVRLLCDDRPQICKGADDSLSLHSGQAQAAGVSEK
jgi:UDP-N-acetylenolpyruvoylglucosamine reductase